MSNKKIVSLFVIAGVLLSGVNFTSATESTWTEVDQSVFINRIMLPDPTATACPEIERSLTHIEGNLYRHTSGNGLAVHSGLVLINKEGALIIDPAMTCTSVWLKDEIKKKHNAKVKYVIYTHGHNDHIAGAQIFQQDGAKIIAHKNSLEAVVGENLPTAVPDLLFDNDMSFKFGGETVELYRIAPSHSNSMTLVSFPEYNSMQCTDICQNKTMPYNDFLDFYYDGWIESLDWIIRKNPKFIDIGHYSPATTKDQIALRTYLIDLNTQILNLVRSGQSWDQLYRNVKFSPEVQSWVGFNNMKTLNVLGMHRWVINHRRGVW